MKKSRPKPDTRLDWRDPDMPVIGRKSGNHIDHRKQTLVSQMSLAMSLEPHWRIDPTYNLRKKPK
jgi:hypothetical protein